MNTFEIANQEMGSLFQTVRTGDLLAGLAKSQGNSIAARAAGDINESQANRRVMISIIEVLTERVPELDLAIDGWCDEMSDDRTMAQFIIDWFDLNDKVGV